MSNFAAVVCDIDGVLYTGEQPIPGAGEALAQLDDAGLRLVFATNNSTREADEVAATILRRTGFAATSSQVVSSAMATAHHLRDALTDAFVVGGVGLTATLEAAGVRCVERWQDAGAVVVGLDPELTYARLADAALAVRYAGARLVATNTDPTYPSSRGLLPGGGALVAALETATDAVAEVCGKPHEPMRDLLIRVTAPGPVVIVGDRIDTDMALGWAEGWTTVLTLTGVTSATEAAAANVDHVVASLADVPGLLGV